MDAIIKLDDIKVKEWEKAKIEFDVVDQNDNPLKGRVAVKINQETKFDTNIDRNCRSDNSIFNDRRKFKIYFKNWKNPIFHFGSYYNISFCERNDGFIQKY